MNKLDAIALVRRKAEESGFLVTETSDGLSVEKTVSAFNVAAQKDIVGTGKVFIRFRDKLQFWGVGSPSRGKKVISMLEELGLHLLEIDDWQKPPAKYSEYFGAADEESF